MMESRLRGGPFVTPGGGRYHGRGNSQGGRAFMHMSASFSDIVSGSQETDFGHNGHTFLSTCDQRLINDIDNQ